MLEEEFLTVNHRPCHVFECSDAVFGGLNVSGCDFDFLSSRGPTEREGIEQVDDFGIGPAVLDPAVNIAGISAELVVDGWAVDELQRL